MSKFLFKFIVKFGNIRLDIIFVLQIKEDTNKSIFEYEGGFISKVGDAPLSVHVVNLRMESIKHLISIGDDDSDDKENDEKEKDDLDDENYEIGNFAFAVSSFGLKHTRESRLDLFRKSDIRK